MGQPFFMYFCGPMKRTIYMTLLGLLLSMVACAQPQFKPGDVVPKPYLKVFGYEQFFKVSSLPEQVMARMNACSYKGKTGACWDDLSYLKVLHCDLDGNAIIGEMVCNTAIASDLLEIFKTLYQSGYPIEKMRLIDLYGGDDEASMRDNNTSCFNQRDITAGGKVSKHSYGMAVDINPKYNPYYKVRNGMTHIQPKGSEYYINRSEVFPYKIEKGDLCYRLFRQHGFRWGGDWLSGKDYQHFEK